MEMSPAATASLYEALERESERLTTTRDVDGDSLEDTLEGLIYSFDTPSGGPVDRFQKTFTLLLRKPRGHVRASTPSVKALKALSVILTHSYRLNKAPALKVEFWLYIICSRMMHEKHHAFRQPTVDPWL